MSNSAMTKSDLVNAIASATDSDKATAGRLLNATLDAIAGELKGGGSVTIPGFGKFYTQDRPERTLRNPFNGSLITKSADRAAKFKFSKSFKDSLN